MNERMNNGRSGINELQIIDKSNIRLKYFLTFLSIGQCGVGFIALKEVFVVSFILLVALSIVNIKHFSYFLVLPWAIANIILYVLQSIAYDAFDVKMVQLTFFALRLIVPAMYLAIIGKEYYKYFIKIMYIYTLISFFFWGIEVLVPGLGSILRSLAVQFSRATGSFVVDYKNISLFLLYTFTTSSDFHLVARNAGPFWEPGAFAVYLAVALVFLFLSNRSVRNKYVLVFCLALLTTQSTAGYLSLYFFLAWVVLVSRSKYKLMIFAILVVTSYSLYNYAPFMNRKISEMYSRQSTADLSGLESGRFYAARRSVNAYGQHPLIGRGITRRTSYDEESEFYGSYGIIDIPARFGLIMGSLYFILVFLSLKKYAALSNRPSRTTYAIAAFVVLSPVYFSQGVYLSVINLIILQTCIIYKDLYIVSNSISQQGSHKEGFL